MDFAAAVDRAWKIALLQRNVVHVVADDIEALVPGLLIAAIGGALSSAFSFNPLLIVGGFVGGAAGAIMFGVILHVLSLALGGKGSLLPFLRASSHAEIVSWFALVPLVGHVVTIAWHLVIGVVLIEELHGLSRTRAVIVVLIPLLVVATCCAFFFAAILGLVMQAAHLSH